MVRPEGQGTTGSGSNSELSIESEHAKMLTDQHISRALLSLLQGHTSTLQAQEQALGQSQQAMQHMRQAVADLSSRIDHANQQIADLT
jgi:hypothetical protein